MRLHWSATSAEAEPMNSEDGRWLRDVYVCVRVYCENDSEAVLGVWLPAPADAASTACSRRALAVGRWRGERFGRYRCLTLRYSLLLSVWVDPSAEHRRRDEVYGPTDEL